MEQDWTIANRKLPQNEAAVRRAKAGSAPRYGTLPQSTSRWLARRPRWI